MNCRLCKNQSLKTLYKYEGFDVQKCSSCNLVQVSSEPSAEDLDKLYSESYFKKGKYVQDEAIKREQDRRVKWLLKTGLGSGGKILDVGCATGDFMAVAQNTFEVWGQDISPYAVETAESNYPKLKGRLRSGPIEQLDYEPGSFDAITMWDVVEHLWDPVGVMQQALKWLKPGGYVFMSTPNIGAVTAKLMGRYWAFMTPPEHLVFFDYHTWQLMLKNLGLEERGFISRGKWVNTGFLFYKLNRVMPVLMPGWVLDKLSDSVFARSTVYVPTGDIMYTAARLPEAKVTAR